MPIAQIQISKLATPPYFPTVPYHYDFLMDLYTNNYSKFTIYNYFRDLIFLALFLKEYGLKFEDLTVDHITHYKNWLKQRKHILALMNHLKHIKETDPQAAQEAARAMGVRQHLLKAFEQDKQLDAKEKVKNNNPTELSNKTINRMLITLRRYLKFLLMKGVAPPLLPDQVQLTKTPKTLLKVPELEAIIALVEAPSHLEKDEFARVRNRAILEMLLATGMRISEIVSLNREDLTGDQIYVKGKGKKERIVYLTPRAKKYLREYLQMRNDTYPAMFIPTWAYKRTHSKSKRISPNANNDPRISISYLQQKIKEYREMLKLEQPISAHTIRHAFATYLIENGANVEAVRMLLGHESIGTTTKYVHAAQEFARQTHKKLHPVKE